MYVKLFAKILDSSIWLEPDFTRITWITLLASMNEDGFCAFACDENLANRARLRPSSVSKALVTLSSSDPRSADSAHEGRRVERVPGGWMVLNAVKYRELATREQIKESTRERVRRHREKLQNSENLEKSEKKSKNLKKSQEISPVSPLPSVSGNAPVTQAETYTERDKELLSDQSSDAIPLSELRRKGDEKVPIRRVFEYYREKIGKSTAYTLTDKRMKQGLKRFGEAVKMAPMLRPDLPISGLPEAAEKLMRYAVDRMAEDDWAMGRTRNSKRPYNDWDNLFRSAEQFQEWVEREQCQTTTA